MYSSYYGGTGNGQEGDVGLGISVESATDVAITGAAFSSNIPLSAHPAQSGFLGGTTHQHGVCRDVQYRLAAR